MDPRWTLGGPPSFLSQTNFWLFVIDSARLAAPRAVPRAVRDVPFPALPFAAGFGAPSPPIGYIRWGLLCFPMKYLRFCMFLRAAHASLPVPSARSAELHCRVDVSGCEWLYFDEKTRPLRQGLVFRLFPVSIWNWIHSFIHPFPFPIRN